MEPKYPIVLLDADDTIFDFTKACHHSLNQVFEQYGIENTEENHETYLKVNHAVWDDFEKGLITKAQLRVERFSRLFSLLGIERDAEAMSDSYVEALSHSAFLINGALDVCRQLSQKRRLYLVTNGVAQVQYGRLALSPVKETLSGIFVSEDVGVPKPNPGYFEYVFSKIEGFSKDKAIIVGDSLTSDIAGGVNAGIATCWYNPKGQENHSGNQPDYEVRTLSELIEIL